MQLHEFIRTYHTEISLIGGPVVAWLISKLPKLHVLFKAVLFVGVMFLLVGIWGLILNTWLLLVLLVFYAIKHRTALAPLQYLSLGLGVLLTSLAIAFYGYMLFTKPGEFFSNLRNPLMYVYALPGILALSLSGHIKEVRGESRNT